jgi:hypothetical protein
VLQLIISPPQPREPSQEDESHVPAPETSSDPLIAALLQKGYGVQQAIEIVMSLPPPGYYPTYSQPMIVVNPQSYYQPPHPSQLGFHGMPIPLPPPPPPSMQSMGYYQHQRPLSNMSMMPAMYHSTMSPPISRTTSTSHDDGEYLPMYGMSNPPMGYYQPQRPPLNMPMMIPMHQSTPTSPISSASNDDSDYTTRLAILVAEQDQEFGTNMFDSLLDSDELQLQQLIDSGRCSDEAVYMIFLQKKRNNQLPSQQHPAPTVGATIAATAPPVSPPVTAATIDPSAVTTTTNPTLPPAQQTGPTAEVSSPLQNEKVSWYCMFDSFWLKPSYLRQLY